jgi:prepilin-type N-terminal cleavage/methylation domain-containing protein
MSLSPCHKNGFTLIELLVQVTIFGLVAAMLVSITFITLRVKNKGLADNEVSGQLNFVMQTIQRLTREATAVSVPSSNTLNLTRAGDTTTITLSGGVITLKEGAAAPTTNLTNSQVVADTLTFTRITNTSAPDTVQIVITLSHNTNNPLAASTRSLQSSASPLY